MLSLTVTVGESGFIGKTKQHVKTIMFILRTFPIKYKYK